MFKLYVKDIINKLNGKLLIGDENLSLDNFSKDTRTIKKGDIYLGIKGETFDGNNFYKEALNKGAACCILDNIDENIDLSLYKDKTIIKVDDTIKCIQELARYKRSKYNIPVIAVTGSVGKTSTKDIIYEVVKTKYKTLKTEGNENNHIGLPLTILKLKDEEVLVTEMGMNHLGELSILTNIVKPTIAVITNIGTAHIGNLGSRENILKAKLEITEPLTKDNTLIINNDNDLLNKEATILKDKYNLVTIGINNKSTYNATNIKDNIFSSTFEIENNKININVGSKAFIYNALVAYSVGKSLNIENKKIIEGINNFKLSPHRLEKKDIKNNITIIDDTYNANLDSMLNSLSILSKVKNRRRVAILGDILELGSYEEEIHRKIGKYINNNILDILIAVGNNSKYIKEEALNNKLSINSVYLYNNYREVIDNIDKILKENDIVLIKASHGMELTKIVDYLVEK
ncbi:MAG: UDP-N-acetylmuramoyl-tripeptide--D-alanyl-D-alanine ligase [Bacilli bacterium]|nr:UDP-N-acetylmuramoyl-tripeptide--D-alanyl-D-alanine ligase [Bacilli bacterium]